MTERLSSHSTEPSNESESRDDYERLLREMGRIQEPVVTIDRKSQVTIYLVAVFIFGSVILFGTLVWFGGRGIGNVNRLMLCLLGMF
ncbi:MAG: hypothetical protein ABL921_08065, partial [Pirellula sp.]